VSESRTRSELVSRIRSIEWQIDDLQSDLDELHDELFKIEHACPNCGEIAQQAGEPCSRRCALQLEYADELKAGAA